MGLAADAAGIQFRVLNNSKGPAVRATRSQSDKFEYKKTVRSMLEMNSNISMFQQEVADIIVEKESIRGVVTKSGISFHAKTVILTAGTFLGGVIHIGRERYTAGRAGDAASNILAERFRERCFEVGRLKTGTPARIDGRTIDYSKLDPQHGDEPRPRFSFLTKSNNLLRQVPCYITYTNSKTAKVIKDNLKSSAIFSGAITSAGLGIVPPLKTSMRDFLKEIATRFY